jgi:hypothetical protein
VKIVVKLFGILIFVNYLCIKIRNMAHQYFKTKYKEEVHYGAGCYEEEHTLYVHHNESCDIVSFYDDKGNCVLSFTDTLRNNIFDAIQRLNFPYKEEWFGELLDDVEMLNADDHKILDERYKNAENVSHIDDEVESKTENMAKVSYNPPRKYNIGDEIDLDMGNGVVEHVSIVGITPHAEVPNSVYYEFSNGSVCRDIRLH